MNRMLKGKREKDSGRRRALSILLCALAVAIATGCAEGEEAGGAVNRAAGQSAGVEDVLQAGVQSDGQAAEEQEVEDKAEEQSAATDGTVAEKAGTQSGESDMPVPDVDLTKLSSTLVYSEVYNMMSKPEDYIGKVIKMKGQYTVYHDDQTDMNYYACIIQDATACCAQGMEFVLTEDYHYPEDYPEEGQEIAVVGIYDTYMEGDYKFCTLRNAVLTD